MNEAVISGMGESHPQRKSGRSVEVLLLEAVQFALEEAKVAANQIGAVITESSLTPQMAPYDRIATMAGINNVQLTMQSTPVGAGILAALGLAFDLVASGKVDHALTYFGVDWGTHPGGPTGYHAGLEAKQIIEAPAGFAGPPIYFGMAAKRYQYLHGLSDDQLQEMLWQVVEATRYNASHHPHSQVGEAITRSEYLAKSMIAEPLRSADCSLLSDGAIAIVVSKKDVYAGQYCPIGLAGWSYDCEPIPDMDFYTQSPWLPDLPVARRSSKKALTAAGLDINQVDAFQVYDCFSIAVVMQLEAIGLCNAGEGRLLCQDGNLRFDGKTPTNTHGGLLAHGYLLGAGHVPEAVHQLRHNAGQRQVPNAQNIFVGAGPGRQYTSLIFKRLEN